MRHVSLRFVVLRRSGIRSDMNPTLPLSPNLVGKPTDAKISTASPAPHAGPILIHWEHKGVHHEAMWRSERGAAAPKRVVLADDTLPADTAYRLACEGTGLLWSGDFHNARQLLQALTRRLDKPKAASKQQQRAALKAANVSPSSDAAKEPAGQAFHLHRQAQAHRARVLGMVLLPLSADYTVGLRRAPDAHAACAEAWGAAAADSATSGIDSVVSLRELLGLIGAHEWRKTGVEIECLGQAPDNRIHPHYGVYSPVRGEYLDLLAAADLPAGIAAGVATGPVKGQANVSQVTPATTAFDIGTGTGVIAALLARRGVAHIVATDTDPRAIRCARANIKRLDVMGQVQIQVTDMFPEGLASLIVCNPPWLPARASAPIERAVYDEGSVMLLAYLNGLAAHLAPGGEGWLVMSDLAEHLGLRSGDFLSEAIASAGLVVLGVTEARPQHRKAQDATDPLYKARSQERTRLWRLGVAPGVH